MSVWRYKDTVQFVLLTVATGIRISFLCLPTTIAHFHSHELDLDVEAAYHDD
jgi:hypothetical protein